MQATQVARYLAIPLQLAPLLFILVFSLLTTIATYAGLLGIPLAVLIFLGFIRYSFALRDAVFNEAPELPVLTVEMLNPIGELRSIVILAIAVALFFGTGAAAYWMPPIVRIALGVLALTFLLAIVAVQCITGSLVRALDPRRWIRLIAALRQDWLLVMLCGALFFVLGRALAGWNTAPFVVRVALLMYVWLALFAFIGGVLYERREDLVCEETDDIEPVPLDTTEATERQRDREVDQIYAQWRSGAYRNAWQTIATLLQKSADPIPELRWLYRRISRWPDRRLADRVAQELVTCFLAVPSHGEVLNLVGERLRVSAEFRPSTSTELIRVVEMARDIGERRIARTLLKDFERLFPRDAMQAQIEKLQQQLE